MLNQELQDRLKGYSFLVTGGAGFIGANIARGLADHGAKEIRVLDNLSTGNRRNIAELEKEGKLHFIEGDIRDPATCTEACRGIDIVLHQAALGSVQRSISDPVTTNAVNVSGFLNMITAAKDNGVKRFVYASSSSVYGDDRHMPKVEEQTGRLLSPYAVTKRMNEEYARVFTALYGMETIGLRYFNVFGPCQDVNGPYAAVIPLFIEAMLSGVPASIYGDGENTRDFTYVENVVLANLRAATAMLPKDHSPVLNIAFGGTSSLNTLHRILSQLTGNKLAPAYAPVRKGDIRDSFADISKARALLGYEPSTGLEEGLEKTVAWFAAKKKATGKV